MIHCYCRANKSIAETSIKHKSDYLNYTVYNPGYPLYQISEWDHELIIMVLLPGVIPIMAAEMFVDSAGCFARLLCGLPIAAYDCCIVTTPTSCIRIVWRLPPLCIKDGSGMFHTTKLTQ